jgi:hypothetical protein
MFIPSHQNSKYRFSLENIFYEIKEKEQIKVISLIFDKKEGKSSYSHKSEINNFSDTFIFNGRIFEMQVQTLLMQIFKFHEIKEKSFQFLCNISYKKLENFTDIELDFLINNIDKYLFENCITYLSKNILFLNYEGDIYEMNGTKKISDIRFKLKNGNKFDVLGEIGLNILIIMIIRPKILI